MLKLDRTCVVAMLVCAASPSAATTDLQGCFTRTYDTVHLQQHRTQQVRRLWLRIMPSRYDAKATEFGMNVWLRGKPQIWRAGGLCDATENGWSCRPDTDGASMLLITRQGGKLRLDNPGKLKISDDVTGPDLNDALIGGPGDSTFDLQPAAASACKDKRS
ncbi:MAG: hypothetical protein JWN07_409 [Hyphomicrobiales bacterium]|nr:hypothetical protein [Hyphomicrobiales bacterium]